MADETREDIIKFFFQDMLQGLGYRQAEVRPIVALWWEGYKLDVFELLPIRSLCGHLQSALDDNFVTFEARKAHDQRPNDAAGSPCAVALHPPAGP